jgi:hypothetical protein
LSESLHVAEALIDSGFVSFEDVRVIEDESQDGNRLGSAERDVGGGDGIGDDAVGVELGVVEEDGISALALCGVSVGVVADTDHWSGLGWGWRRERRKKKE